MLPPTPSPQGSVQAVLKTEVLRKGERLIQDQPNSADSVNSINAITMKFLIQTLFHVAPCKNCKNSHAKNTKSPQSVAECVQLCLLLIRRGIISLQVYHCFEFIYD